MEDKKDVFRLIFKHTAETFLPTVVFFTIIGMTIGDAAPEGGLFAVGQEGLRYLSIMQVFAWSLLMGVLITLFTSDIFFKKTMLLWRYAMLFFIGIVVTGLFAIVFQWFPRGIRASWVVFLAGFGFFFGVALLATYVITKREDKKLEQLLQDYKSKQKNEETEDIA